MSERQLIFRFDGVESQRLDKFLVFCMPEYSRTRLQSWIKGGRVTVDGVAVTKAGEILDREAEIIVNTPKTKSSRLEPEDIPLDVIFENSDLIVVNKPAGMVVHPAVGHASGTLVNAALAHDPDIAGVGGVQRPGVVHRLDKNTSGLILLAKNDRAHIFLQKQFQDREVDKVYHALVDDVPPTSTGRVEVAIARDHPHRKRMTVVPAGRGRDAITIYRTLQKFRNHTYLEVFPRTGRTHQIRVHLAYLGCPVVGDTLYGRKKPSLEIKRHFLHAQRLALVLPGEREPRSFEAPLPADLQVVLTRLSEDRMTLSDTDHKI